jgi:hypothetical protein
MKKMIERKKYASILSLLFVISSITREREFSFLPTREKMQKHTINFSHVFSL